MIKQKKKKEKDIKILLLFICNIIGLLFFYLSIDGLIERLDIQNIVFKFIYFDNFELVFLVLNTLCTVYVTYSLFNTYQNKSTKINDYLNQLYIEAYKNNNLRLKIIYNFSNIVPVIFVGINIIYFILYGGVSLLIFLVALFL